MDIVKHYQIYFLTLFCVGFFALFSFMPLSFYQSSPYTRSGIIAQFVVLSLGSFLGFGFAILFDHNLLEKIMRPIVGILWVLFLIQLTNFLFMYPGPTFQSFGYFLLNHSIYLTLFNLAAAFYFGTGCFNLVNLNYLSLNLALIGPLLDDLKIILLKENVFGKIIIPALCTASIISSLGIYIGYRSGIHFIFYILPVLLLFGLDSMINLPDSSKIVIPNFQKIKEIVIANEKKIKSTGTAEFNPIIRGIGDYLELLLYLISIGLIGYFITTFQAEMFLYINYSYAFFGCAIGLFSFYRLSLKISEKQYLIAFICVMSGIFFMESLSQLYFMLRYEHFYQIMLGLGVAMFLVRVFNIRINKISKGQVWFAYLFGIFMTITFMLLMLEFGNDKIYLIELELLNSTYFNFTSINDLVLLTRIAVVAFLFISGLTLIFKHLVDSVKIKEFNHTEGNQ
jgi:hypothetical protein